MTLLQAVSDLGSAACYLIGSSNLKNENTMLYYTLIDAARVLRSASDKTMPVPAKIGIIERAIAELEVAGRPLDTRTLIRQMEAQGFVSEARDVYLSVYGVLRRAAMRPDSPIVKLGNRWGLLKIHRKENK